MEYQHETHITNLDVALGIIAQVGFVYNKLERNDQKELLHQMVERVIVNPAGKAKLELRAPFAYLSDISKRVSNIGEISGVERSVKTKIGRDNSTDYSQAQCSDWVLCCGRDRIRTCVPV